MKSYTPADLRLAYLQGADDYANAPFHAHPNFVEVAERKYPDHPTFKHNDTLFRWNEDLKRVEVFSGKEQWIRSAWNDNTFTTENINDSYASFINKLAGAKAKGK